MNLYVIRHGETDSNRTSVVMGRSAEVLNARGRAQAAEVKAELERIGVNFAAVYCSPVRRAVQTAELILPLPGDPPMFLDARISERDLAGLAGYKIDDLWRLKEWNSVAVERMAVGAETLLGGLNRTRAFLGDLSARHPLDNIVIITHSFISRCLWMLLSGITDPAETYTFTHPNSEIKYYHVDLPQ